MAPEKDWHPCTVLGAGPAENGKIFVEVKAENGSFQKWYPVLPAVGPQVLQTALVAVQLRLRCRVLILPENPNQISGLYVFAPDPPHPAHPSDWPQS
jgi:hypothetical protein